MLFQQISDGDVNATLYIYIYTMLSYLAWYVYRDLFLVAGRASARRHLGKYIIAGVWTVRPSCLAP